MNIDTAVELGRAAILMTLLLSAPVLLISMAAGFVISLFQAVTQIQDQTLSFVPKIVAMTLTLLFVLPWAMETLSNYTTDLFLDIPLRLFN